MKLALLLSLQAAAAPAATEVRPGDFDLARYRPSDPRCDGGTGSEIVVCGRRPNAEGYPLEEKAKLYQQGPLRAETRLFGAARGRAYVEGVTLPNGQKSNRIMVGIKLPF